MLSQMRLALHSSRRAFLGGIATSGLVLSSVVLGRVRGGDKAAKSKNRKFILAGNGRSNSTSGLSSCLAACEAEYYACCAGVQRSRRSALWKATVGYQGCMTSWIACQVACEAEAIGQALSSAVDWIASHPEAVVGAIVVIGGVTFVVVATGGGGLALAPFLVL